MQIRRRIGRVRLGAHLGGVIALPPHGVAAVVTASAEVVRGDEIPLVNRN